MTTIFKELFELTKITSLYRLHKELARINVDVCYTTLRNLNNGEQIEMSLSLLCGLRKLASISWVEAGGIFDKKCDVKRTNMGRRVIKKRATND